ncbi:hypothetical protein HDU96_008476 [Phlyctochytrium bullatum]|nr:hypothetical protein HDU96_008476 [Phlyctochytrium bullatum]
MTDWLDDDRPQAFLENLPLELYQTLSKNDAAALPIRFETLEQEINFLALFYLLNFGSGWRQELHKAVGRGAFDTIRFGMMSMHISGQKLNAAFLRDIRAPDVASFFDLPFTEDVPHPTMAGVTLSKPHPLRPFIENLTKVMNETGQFLAQNGYAAGLGAFILDITKPVDGSPRSTSDVVESLARGIPGFRDMGTYQGKDIFIFKKVQLLVSSLSRRFSSTDPKRFAFSGTELLTIGADNVIPRVLGALDILKFSPEIERMIEEQVDFGLAGMDWVLRGAAIEAAERIVEKARIAFEAQTLSVEIKTVELESYLWMLGKESQYRPLKRPVNKQTSFY